MFRFKNSLYKYVILFWLLNIRLAFTRTSELLCVVQFSRHGARTSNTFQSKTFNKVFGEQLILTPNGFRQHELLGKFIKDKYTNDIPFLINNNIHSRVEIISTPVQRTINSAMAFINGFYPGAIVKMNYQNSSHLHGVINNDTIPIENAFNLQYEEIPITILSTVNDFFHRGKCLYRGDKLQKRVEYENKGISLYDEIHNNLNITELSIELAKFLNVDPPEDMDDVDNGNYLTEMEKYLQTFLYHYGKNLDDPMLSRDFAKIIKMQMVNKKYSFRVRDSKYLRILTSEIFQMILNKFEASIYDEQERKLFVYFTHDSTFMNLFGNLIVNDKLKEYTLKAINDKDYYDFIMPPYASTILFELYRRNNGYFVIINYNGKLIEKDLKYIDNNKITNGEIQYNNFQFMLTQLIEKDYRKLLCDGTYIDETYIHSLDYTPSIKKKDYTRHFLKKPKK